MAQTPSHHPAARRPRAHPLTWIVVTVLLAAAVVGTLWVPFYNQSTPELGGFPFFYWYQLLWIPIVALLSWLAYLLIKRIHREPRRPDSPAPIPAPRRGQGEVN